MEIITDEADWIDEETWKDTPIEWFKELWEYILKQMDGDKELAKSVYKRILFEEKWK